MRLMARVAEIRASVRHGSETTPTKRVFETLGTGIELFAPAFAEISEIQPYEGLFKRCTSTFRPELR